MSRPQLMLKSRIGLLLLLVGAHVGCSRVAPNAADPVNAFDRVIKSIQAKIASPREYLGCARGNYNQRPNFGGPPEDAGKPFENYKKVMKEWEVKGYDVRRTDSLVSPYEAVLVIAYRETTASGGNARLQQPDDALRKPYGPPGKWFETKCTYNWRDGQWIPGRAEWPFGESSVPFEEKNGGQPTPTMSYKRLR